jgi:predicted outer membrane repeat protein
MAWIVPRKAGYVGIRRIRGHDYIRGYDHMHHKLMRASARTAVIGAVIVLGSTAAAQGAMAKPAPSGIVSVACNTPALVSAFAGASNGEKLQLAFGCTYRLTEPLPNLDTNTTIVGMGATLERSKADGTRDFTILTVAGGDVNLVEVNFRNGGGGGDDDGVVADDDVNDYGGAIYNAGGNITVLGGTFTDNGDVEYGGAIFNADGTLTMTSAYFIGNNAYYGGAIYNEDTMTLRSTHFLGSEAEYGGAIYNDDDATVIGTSFTEDEAYYGGALDNEHQAALSYVTIKNNYGGYGAGIYNDDSLAVDHSNIVHNYAEYEGGGIYYDDGTVTLSLTKVSGNGPDNCYPNGSITGCSG